MLSVVPRPHSGSKIAIGPLVGRRIEANVTLINNRVNCSLVFPGYLGMVTKSSSKRSLVPSSIGSSRSWVSLEDGVETREPAERRSDLVVQTFRRQRQISDAGHGHRLDHRMIMSVEHDLEFSRYQPVGFRCIDAIGRWCQQDQMISHVLTVVYRR